jgi:glycosyltransferase involved in cell wall biosynthesis
MKFSISTSFYKRSHLVESVYQQILNQTYTNWEWIVTDDFSEENSAREKLLEICANDSRVKYYEQSRKKECFYNPQRGATGDIIVMFDSDDYAYPRILEMYHHMFIKHPEIIGISCFAKVIDNNTYGFDGIFPYHDGEYSLDSHFNNSTIGIITMYRAFKNIFIEFDSGILKSYYNDLNIVRHMETMGKWLVLPRVLCNYDKTDTNSISRQKQAWDGEDPIHVEWNFIENKFPHLYNPDKYSSFSYYFPVMEVSRILCFGEFNEHPRTKNILLINPKIKLYQKQLLKELYYEHNIYYDYKLNQKFDEIIVEINEVTIELLFDIKQILHQSNPGVRIYFRSLCSAHDFEPLFSKIREIFGGVGYHRLGSESFFITGV